MSVTYSEYWDKISVTRSELQQMMTAQLTVYKGFRDKTSEGASKAVFAGILSGILFSFFKKSAPGIIASALVGVVNEMDTTRRIQNANALIAGHTVLEEIYDVLNRSTSYQKIEATVFFREFRNTRTGETIRAVVGNSENKGGNSGAYHIDRIQTTSGGWILG